MTQPWFHAIGICGKTTANIAKMFKDMGWFVTGSDAQFMPPAVNILDDNEINYVEDYHYSHLTREFWEKRLETQLHQGSVGQAGDLNIGENPDLVLVLSFLTSGNKEFRFAKVHNLDVRPYAKILGEYLIKEKSIVVVGTAGKTTTTALTTLILKNLGLDPSYMIGADVVDLADSIQNTDSKWSVIEGDEYHSPDPVVEEHAKFLEYKAKYVILTNIGWEHPDIYPAQEIYNEEFKKLLKTLPNDGILVTSENDVNVEKVIGVAPCKIVKVGKFGSKTADYTYQIYGTSQLNKLGFNIYNKAQEKIITGDTSLIGEYNIVDFALCTALLFELKKKGFLQDEKNPLDLEKKLGQVMNEFGGVRKRLEKLYEDDSLTIIDDFGVTPPRAKNSLATLRNEYPEHKIIAVFEPYGGGRPINENEFGEMYKGVFDNVNELIIPDLSVFERFTDTETFVERLKKSGVTCIHVPTDKIHEELADRIEANKDYKTLIVFFSSYRLDEIAHRLANEI